jgi:hypothetical protein
MTQNRNVVERMWSMRFGFDSPPSTALETITMGHLHGPRHARVALNHEDADSSPVLLPITRGNRIGTFDSCGAQESPG